jgi:hypothetical protein
MANGNASPARGCCSANDDESVLQAQAQKLRLRSALSPRRGGLLLRQRTLLAPTLLFVFNVAGHSD